MAGAEALAAVLAAAREALAQHDTRSLRVVRGGSGDQAVRCVLPCLAGSRVATAVDGEALLAAAELLADSTLTGTQSPGSTCGDASIAAALVEGVARAGGVEMWPPALQVRWLCATVSSLQFLQDIRALTASAVILLKRLCEQPMHGLLPHAPRLFAALRELSETDSGSFAASTTSALACLLVKEVRQNLFRLTLQESHVVIRDCLRFTANLPTDWVAPVRAEAALLFKMAVDGLPAKFRAECVFHRRSTEGLAPADVVAWCSLLADGALLDVVGNVDAVPEETWSHALHEALEVIRCGDLDDAAPALLGAFAVEGRRRNWSADDELSPLGAMVVAVKSEWQRAIIRDGELEDPIHEPARIPDSVEQRLRELFDALGIPPPSSEKT